MTLNLLFGIAEDTQKLYITAPDGSRHVGYWYDDHMLDIMRKYKAHKVDVTADTPEMLVARVRRF